LKRTIPTPTFRRGPSTPEGSNALPSFPLLVRADRAGARDAEPKPEPESELPPEPKKPKPKTAPKSRKAKPMPDPRKGGRPRHNPETVRDTGATISLSREEAAALSAAAAAAGMPFSQWVRYVLFDVAKVAPRPHAERAVLSGSALSGGGA
jgi:outer membrane biosynthesis protein TonB